MEFKKFLFVIQVYIPYQRPEFLRLILYKFIIVLQAELAEEIFLPKKHKPFYITTFDLLLSSFIEFLFYTQLIQSERYTLQLMYAIKKMFDSRCFNSQSKIVTDVKH